MENAPDSGIIEAEKVNLCIICQKEKNESLVEKPSSHEKVLKFIEEWASYGDFSYSKTWGKLRSISPRELEAKQASWHRSCYKDAVHTGMLKRAKERYERQLACPSYRQTLHNVSTCSAGESLCTAVCLSGNDKLSVKLSTAVAANDAHSIDIKYHKNCWVNNVTNVIRKPASAAASSSSLE
ncbi:hypothetical protein OS493_029162 [Desmophyllum pertusum]|uniref:Uncharacterized protein n=1 Tax=Desmophyllum pertusum TaxID=174260 RepID=A0A9X0D707_9CNID|nr:hypothetical protein OS493_029162 [Desmophyllum pertusum]